MKKLMLALAAVAAVGVVNAANIDWQYFSDADHVNDTVYVLKSVAGSYANVSALAAAAIDSDVIASYKSGPTTYYAAGGKDNKVHTIAWDAAENGGTPVTFYQVLVHGDEYAVATISGTTWGGQVAEPANPDGIASKTAFNTWAGTATWTKFEGGGDVPEPTSAMLLLLGVAGLALRRRHA